MYDIVLKDGLIIDGTGARSFRGSVALTDGKIAYVGTQDNLEGKKVIDCRSLHITPGFIDAHSHGDIVLGHEFPSFAKLSQGITTEVVGQCGISMAPVSAENIDKLLKYVESFMISAPEDISQYITYKGYRDCVKKQELYLTFPRRTWHTAYSSHGIRGQKALCRGNGTHEVHAARGHGKRRPRYEHRADLCSGRLC